MMEAWLFLFYASKSSRLALRNLAVEASQNNTLA